MITVETWMSAQVAERKWWDKHHWTRERFEAHYAGYFEHLDIDKDCRGMKIIEIGSADVPALSFCENVRGVIIEPNASPSLESLCNEREFILEKVRAEDYDFPDVDEVWMFNVLQHVLCPDTIIKKAINAALRVRFFEPIEYKTDNMHLHSFTVEYFKQFFKDVRRYEKHPMPCLFHTHQCAYGVNYV